MALPPEFLKKRAIYQVSDYHDRERKLDSIRLFFQANPHLPIHLKGGSKDQILFGLTIAGCIIGLGGCAEFFWKMAHKRWLCEL